VRLLSLWEREREKNKRWGIDVEKKEILKDLEKGSVEC
jgi:hypothetical protein